MINHPVKVPVSTDTLTVSITAGSTNIADPGATGTLLASVAVGQRVFGVGIPFGATVTAIVDTDNITISEAATVTNAGASIQFEYIESSPSIYAAGDVLGFPFKLPMMEVNNIMVVDAAKVITAVKLYLYRDVPAPILDNAAFAPTDAEARKIIAYYSLTGTVALSNNHIIFPAADEMLPPVIGGQKMYGQLVCVGTPTFAAVDDLLINFSGE